MTSDEKLEAAAQQGNELERAISLQLISVATFVISVIGAFVALPVSKPLNLAGKIFLLIDVICLFLSIASGVAHVIVERRLWLIAHKGLSVNRGIEKLLDRNKDNIKDLVTIKAAIFEIVVPPVRGTMAFFYLQAFLAAGSIAILIGLIVTMLF